MPTTSLSCEHSLKRNMKILQVYDILVLAHLEWMRSLSELRAQEINLRAKKRHILSDLSRKSPQKWEGENNI